MRADTLDEAVRALARNITAQLAPNETAHFSENSLAPAFAAETARARAMLERAMRPSRGTTTVEIVVTATENAAGPLLVAQIQKGPEMFVETASYTAAATAPAARPALVSRFLWEQDEPILDLAIVDDQMIVLSASAIFQYRRSEAGWTQSAMQPLPAPARDPRGRLAVSGDSVAAFLPVGTCRGSRNPLSLQCQDGTVDFDLSGTAVRFAAGRNTLSGAAEYAGVGDAVTADANCGIGPLLIASSMNDRASPDSLTPVQPVGQNVRAVGNPLPLNGPVTALWPGALAVVHQLATGKYAAYNVSMDCGR